MTRPNTRTDSFICMSSYNHCSTSSTLSSSTSRSYYNTSHRSKSKHIILRPSRRRRSYSLPTLILILWTSRSLYSNHSWVWGNFTYCFPLQSKTRTLRNIRYNLCYIRNCCIRIYCMSTPHIHCRYRRRYTRILYSSNYNYCCSNRN